jgi:acyl phosphate:glycerol-3-phosphate acyltransferase
MVSRWVSKTSDASWVSNATGSAKTPHPCHPARAHLLANRRSVVSRFACPYNSRPMLELGVKTLLAYLLGSLLGSLIVGQIRGGVDIRTMGSGNAGGTNALRTQGFGFGLWVFVIDIGKGWVVTSILPWTSLPFLSIDPAIDREWLAVACASAVVLGHVYPIWYSFRGGKGAATLIGVVMGLYPAALIPVMLVWLACVMTTGFVGLSTMVASLSFPVFVLATTHDPSSPLFLFGCLMLVFVCYTHRSNIARMRAGNENRARRLWLLRPRA